MRILLTLSACLAASLSQQPLSENLSGGIRQFTTALLSDLELKSSSNFLFSPYSLHSVLSQVMFGARGKTQAQLSQVLGVRPSQAVLNQWSDLSLGLTRGSAQLNTANQLAVARGFKPKPAFSQLLGRAFQSSITEYDFAGDRANAVQQINNLVSQKTEGKIQDLLLEQDVDTLTKMILINVIYFKAQWKKAFNVEDSFYQFFNSPLAGNINTTFMNIEDQFRLYEDPENEFEILELPYADETMSMLIVLPSSPTVQISSKLEGFNFSAIRGEPRREVHVSLPKFNMKYQTYLKKKLTELGAADLFTQASNLKGMSDEDLVVTEGVHQANIEVNEEGSEAAAATAVVVGVRTIRRKKQFYADTPFLFIIYDFQNNVPLFAGKVVDPSNTIQIQDPPETTSQESEGDFDQTLGGTLVSGQPDLETCKRLLRDFPTAFDNHKICRKVKEAGEFLDWLRANRNLCETSEDHYTAFTASNCGSVWCQEAVTARSGWEADYQSQCEVTEDNNRQDCKILENKLKAFRALSC